MPRVSVVIPLYNKADHIRRTLDSIFIQGVDDLEVVVVDDGSTDDSPAIVESYGDERIRLIRQANAGPGAARNHGIRESRSEWIAPLDADDYWFEGFLEHVLGRAEQHPDCDVVTCLWAVDPDDPESIKKRFRHDSFPCGPYRLAVGADPFEMRKLMARFGCRNTLARREALLACGGFYEASRHGEDLYLWLKLLLKCRICLGDEVLAFHDLGASELSHGARARGNVPMPRPVVADPDGIREICPPEYRDQLEALLDGLARREAWHQVQAGRNNVAEDLFRKYPSVLSGWADRMRFRVWMRLGRSNQGRSIEQWGALARWVHKRLKFMRIKSKSV